MVREAKWDLGTHTELIANWSANYRPTLPNLGTKALLKRAEGDNERLGKEKLLLSTVNSCKESYCDFS